tara:strand:+ start:47 stop:295 length:249 start_codon:yes stop_codon:yes gene_type:complete
MADSCQSASAYQEANSLFVDEDYDRAFEQYSKAIDLYDKKGSSGSGLAEIYVKRAACNTKLQKYTGTVNNGETTQFFLLFRL